MNIDKYLYEVIDDYKNANSEEEKSEIFKDFCSSIWGSKNKRRTYIKTIRFKVRSDLLQLEVGKIFNAYSEIEYVGYKEMTKDTDWESLIRQKINNLYTRYFDKEVVLKKDYMELLKTPKNLYYKWMDGEEMNPNELTEVIEDSIFKAQELKMCYQKQKMDLSWNDYKEVVEKFLKNIFNNCRLIEDFEKDNLTNQYIYELATEDNFYIKYFCTYLENEMKQYQKKYYGLKSYSTTKQHKQFKRCKECGRLIEKSGNKKMYCKECANKRNKQSNKISDKKYRDKIRENRNLPTQPNN